MSPRVPGLGPSRPAQGTGPGGRVEMSDIRGKLEEIRGDVNETADEIKPKLVYAAVAGAVVVVVLVFVLGRRRGRRTSTWVEVRRL